MRIELNKRDIQQRLTGVKVFLIDLRSFVNLLGSCEEDVRSAAKVVVRTYPLGLCTLSASRYTTYACFIFSSMLFRCESCVSLRLTSDGCALRFSAELCSFSCVVVTLVAGTTATCSSTSPCSPAPLLLAPCKKLLQFAALKKHFYIIQDFIHKNTVCS